MRCLSLATMTLILAHLLAMYTAQLVVRKFRLQHNDWVLILLPYWSLLFLPILPTETRETDASKDNTIRASDVFILLVLVVMAVYKLYC